MRKYKDFEENEEEYISDDIDRLKSMPIEEQESKTKIVKEIVTKRVAQPRLEDEEIKPLQRKKPAIFGTLFDRVEFMRQRIAEIREAMEERKRLHEEMIKDIDADISEKRSMVNMISDIEEKRNFKLDISILRKEKRTENINFWKDMTELRSELREILEAYETEKRIQDMFKIAGGRE